MEKEKFLNIPNILSIIRILSTFLISYLILNDFNFLITTFLFVIFAFSDILDGFLARKLKQITSFGARLDQVADRIYFGGTATVLIIKHLMSEEKFLINSTMSPIWILFILSREIIALPAFLYLLVKRKEFVKVRFIGKVSTFLQASAITGIMLKLSFAIYLIILTGSVGIISGLTYWYDVAKAKPVKFIKNKMKKIKCQVQVTERKK